MALVAYSAIDSTWMSEVLHDGPYGLIDRTSETPYDTDIHFQITWSRFFHEVFRQHLLGCHWHL